MGCTCRRESRHISLFRKEHSIIGSITCIGWEVGQDALGQAAWLEGNEIEFHVKLKCKK